MTTVDPHSTSNKPRDIRDHNLKLVLQLFRHQETLSINEISCRVKLSKTTVTKLVNLLIRRGQVLPAGKGSSTDEGGKKPELFMLNREAAYLIAINPGMHHITGALFDLSCSVRVQEKVTGNFYEDYTGSLAQMVLLIERLLTAAGLTLEQVYGIAIGCDGIVDTVNGILRYPLHLRWGQELPLREDLQKALQAPVRIVVDNACRFLGQAERMLRGEDAPDCMVTVTSDNSTGGCVIQNRSFHAGRNGFIGEFGHIIVEPSSQVVCQCGCRGCFETMVAPLRVLQLAKETAPSFPDSPLAQKALAENLTMDDLFSGAGQQDIFAQQVLAPVLEYFAVLIHNIVLMHDPQEIVIQGTYARAGDYFLDQLQQQLSKFQFYQLEHHLVISYSKLPRNNDGINQFLIGAGSFLTELYFGQV
jgi:N-acetylglucosamine repressor